MRPNGDMPPPMRAATAGAPGRRGLVPMPPAGSQTKFLRGDGTFQAISGGGDMLAANNLGDVASAATARTNLGVYSQAEVAALRNALAPAQALSGDGTAGATIANTQVFGTSDFSWVAALSVASFADSNFTLSGDANAHVAYISTSGSVVVGQRYGADLTGSGAGTIALNTPGVLGYTRSGTTGKYYLNGALVATITDTLNYSGATTAFGKQFGGSQYFNGTLRLLGIANRALSAAEVLAVYQTGSFPASDFNNGGTAISNSTFVGTGVSGASATGFAFSSGSGQYVISSLGGASAIKKGQRIRVSGTLTGTGTVSDVYIESASAGVGGSILASGAFSMELTCGTGPTATGLVMACNAGSFTISGLTVTRLGLLVAPESNAPGNGYLWNDQSGNGAHILLPGSGVSWTLPSNAQNVIRGKSNTNGNQQLFGADCIPFGTVSTRITRILAKARSGAPAVTLGYISGGNQYGTTTTLAAYWKDVTLGAEAIAQTSSLWAGSNSTDIVDWVIFTQPISV